MSANWIQKKKTQLATTKELEKILMNRPDMREALSRYIASLNLQGQINANIITEKQAAKLFQQAIQQFSEAINREINQHIEPQILDQNDLSNPANMQRALNNPDSPISIQVNDAATSVILAINEEAFENEQEQEQNQQQIINTQHIQTESESQTEIQTPNAPNPTSSSHEKEALLVGAVLGTSLEKDAIEHTFEKYIGKDLKDELNKLEEPNKSESPFEILAPKPKPPTPEEEKK